MLDNISAFLNGENITHETAVRPRPLASGLLVGTRIATTMGWRPVEALAEGDRVLTFDDGLQAITRVSRVRLWDGTEGCPEAFWPLRVPAGVLGNRTAMDVLPGQGVMIESDIAEDIYGDPFALVPAQSVEGNNGVERAAPASDLSVIVLQFESDQIVFADNGTLFFCPTGLDVVRRGPTATSHPGYAVLPLDEARRLTRTPEMAQHRLPPSSSTSDAWSAAVLAFARSKLRREPAPYSL